MRKEPTMAKGYRVVRVVSLGDRGLQTTPITRWVTREQAIAFSAGVRTKASSDEAYGVESRRKVLSYVGKGQA
jgi:hypothetical protein